VASGFASESEANGSGEAETETRGREKEVEPEAEGRALDFFAADVEVDFRAVVVDFGFGVFDLFTAEVAEGRGGLKGFGGILHGVFLSRVFCGGFKEEVYE
jgi:hypothetical protein